MLGENFIVQVIKNVINIKYQTPLDYQWIRWTIIFFMDTNPDVRNSNVFVLSFWKLFHSFLICCIEIIILLLQVA